MDTDLVSRGEVKGDIIIYTFNHSSCHDGYFVWACKNGTIET